MTKMQKARAKLLVKHIFFATLIMSLAMVEDVSIATAATDMQKIFYNPAFIEGLTIGQTMTVLAHEALHVMFKHGLRKRGRNHRVWNMACDYAINLILAESGFELLDGMLLDHAFTGKSAEEIYDLLMKEREKEKKRGGEPGDGQPKPGDRDYGNPFNDDVQEPEHMSAEDKARIEQDIQQRVAQAASMARLAGKLPAGLQRLVDGIVNPPLPWQDLLREFMTRITKNDESWSRRNRRVLDVFLPARHSEQMGEVIVIGDTSGSMNNDDFAQIAMELNCICDTVKPERIRVIWADDTDCALEEVFEQGEELVLHPKGGGGTDMRKPLRYAEQFDPEVVLLITDGWTPWPSVEPDFPLIVACSTSVEVPVGSVVRLRS